MKTVAGSQSRLSQMTRAAYGWIQYLNIHQRSTVGTDSVNTMHS